MTTTKYIVYSETHTNGTITWDLVGIYESRNAANEAAYEMGGCWPTYYCVCPLEDAHKMGLQV